MGALQELIPASFRGVPFLVPSGSVESGRHAVKHTYPDSQTRFVEDNGLRVPDVKINAVVSGIDALSKVRRLEQALSKPGPGTLMHPIRGALFVQVDTYHLKHKDSEVGIYEFDITFLVTGPPSFPGALSGISAAITGLSSQSIFSLFSAFQSQFGTALGIGNVVSGISGVAGLTQTALTGLVMSASAGNAAGLVSTILSPVSAAIPAAISGATVAVIGSTVARAGAVVSAAFGASAAIRHVVDLVTRAPESVAANPPGLAATLYTFARAPFEDTTITAAELWRGFTDLSQEAEAIIADAAGILPSTTDLAVRQNALVTLGTHLQCAAFSGLCEAAAAKSYSTADQVAADITALTDAYDLTADLPVLTEDRNALSNLLAETVTVLQSEQVTLPTVVSLKVWETPASVLCYNLYDSDADLETIVGLNDGATPILYDGAVNVLRVS